MVLLGDAEQIGDDQHGERLGVGPDELAAPVGEELVELLVGEAPHERLVVLQPLRRDQPHQERSLPGVVGRVHRDHVLEHRQVVAVGVDDLAHVVALQRDREGGEGADHGVARGERVGVAVDLAGLLVAGHGHHPEVGQRQDRALLAQLLEVRVRVLHQRLVVEVVGRLPVAHPGSPCSIGVTAAAGAVHSLSDAEHLLSTGAADVATWRGVAPSSSASSSRRIGAPDSKTRAQLVDAAEQLLLEEGYAAVTSRRVAATAGLKPQLVHYYFRTMDDLFVEVFRRRAEENIARFERAIAADGSLRNLWRLNADTRGAVFTVELVALANHRKAIRAEIARYAERFRAVQLDALAAALAADGIGPDELPPVAALLLMTGLSQVLALEQALGVTAGHADTVAFIERALAQLEPATP